MAWSTCKTALFIKLMLLSVVCVAGMAVTGTVAAAHAAMHGPSADHHYEIRIATSHPSLQLYCDGKLYHVYKVALGKANTPTPIGDWRIVDKQKDWGSGFGTRWIGLDVPWGIYGIHGTNRPASIGTRASGGCIRMSNEDVEQLYDLIPVGTRVLITGNPLADRRTLHYGHIGADVRLVQDTLKRAGYFRGPCDGKFDHRLQLALFFFELSRGLPVDACVGDDDYRALGLIPSVSGANHNSTSHG